MIIKEDNLPIKVNLKYHLNQLSKIYKKNQVFADNKYKKFKKINGKFLYEEWKKSFNIEDYKRDEVFLNHVHPNNIPSLSNMGYYINQILDNLKINFNDEDPKNMKKKNVKNNKKKTKTKKTKTNK